MKHGRGDPTPHFDAIARPYRWLEYFTFGPMLERCRFAQLPQLLPHLGGAASALVLGDGDGRFVSALVARYPMLAVDVVDISPAMLALTRTRLPPSARVRLQEADIRCYTPPAGRTYDLIATHFFLDCLTESEIAALIDRLRPALSARAVWVVSEFAVPAAGAMRPVARLLIWTLYRAFRLLTGLRVQALPAYAPLLERNGFVCEDTRLFLGGLLRSERWRCTLLPKTAPQATRDPVGGSH